MFAKARKFLRRLGPGIITGASDDDPSGIATYSIAGAQANYSALWTPLFTFPLMVAIQEMCARIGLVTGRGLAGNMRMHYPRPFLLGLTALVVFANTLNIGANLAGMAAATSLVLPLPQIVLAVAFGGLMLGLMIRFPYRVIANILKWLTFALFAYVLAALLTKQDWPSVLLHTLIPTVNLNREFLILLVAILGTTISPYLFFWQTSEEVEELDETGKLQKTRRVQIVTKNELKVMREDVSIGMFLSNLVMFFIIATAASALYQNGITQIETVKDAAMALRPLAGEFAFLLFALGIVGTGLLSIPVLAGSVAYVVAETFGWREGFNQPFHKARSFYGVIIVSTLLGMAIPFLGIRPIHALYMTAIVYGLMSPILILILLHISNSKHVMGEHTNGFVSNTLGVLTFLIMTGAVGAMFLFR
ncbi:MAG: Nramp family divalent metal transporter [bacterium]|nr:Nramp family divalent metal transporter [bacterium]